MANNQISQKKEKEKTNMCEFKFVPECPILLLKLPIVMQTILITLPINSISFQIEKKPKTYCM